MSQNDQLYDLNSTSKNKSTGVKSPVDTTLPKNVSQNIASLLKRKKINEAANQISKLKNKYSRSPVLWQLDALVCNENKDYFGALQGFQKVVILEPDVASNYSNLGLAYENYGNFEKALENYSKAIEIEPNSHLAYHNMAVALDKQGNIEDSIKSFQSALKIKPEFPEALNNLGALLKKVNRFDEALRCLNLALKFNPNYAEASFNSALIFKQKKQFEKAAEIFNELAKKYPSNIYYIMNFGLCLIEQRSFSEASELFNKIIKEHPDCGEAYLALGAIERHFGNNSQAIKLFEIAITKNSKLEDAYGMLAVCLNLQGMQAEAKAAYHKALEINPSSINILTNFGNFYHEHDEFDKAFETYFKAHQLSLPNTDTVHNLYYSASAMCDWVQTNVLETMFKDVGASYGYSNPFIMMQFEDNPRNQYLRSVKHGKTFLHAKKRFKFPNSKKQSSEKIKIGYFSADFHNHATMRLMSGMFRHHDKSKFSIYSFMYGRSIHDEQTSIARQYSDEFHDISKQGDKEVVEFVRKIDLDIAVDLKGFTKETRSQLFSYGLAPIQINFLGYPSTMGVDFIDYIVADKILIPEFFQKDYAEKIIYMPNSYQPNDNTRQISDTKMTRKSLGVPEDAFLMCCMNNNYKITRTEFEIWLKILEKVDNSFLIFLATNKFAVKNIMEAARKRGIEKRRILFVPKLPYANHLERLTLFDLFLDTFRINAHTTASDALWSGLPVVTKVGNQFAARVAASLLYAVNLPELVTETAEEYETLILDLATNKEKLTSIRKKLQANIKSAPLFDTAGYTKHFEEKLLSAFERHSLSLPPSHIT